MAQKLTGLQGIGIGIAVGFMAALLPILVFAFICRRNFRMSQNRDGVSLPLIRPPHVLHYWEGDQSNRHLPIRRLSLCGPDLTELLSRDLGIRLFVEQYLRGYTPPPLVPDNKWLRSRYSEYPMPKVQESIFNEEDLVALAGPPPSKTWAALLTHHHSRVSTMKRLLSLILIRRMKLDCPAEDSFLPAEILNCHNYLLAHTGVPFQLEFLAIWREMVFQLVCVKFRVAHQQFSGINDDDPRHDQINSTTAKIADVLKLEQLIIQPDPEDGLKHFEYITQHAANAAVQLFANGNDRWEESWETDRPDEIYFPAISVYHDDHLTALQEAEYQELVNWHYDLKS